MLDKSVDYHDIILVRPAGLPLPETSLPPGYSFCFYNDGDERSWAEIEVSVGEFPTLGKALSCFEKDYLIHKSELHKRCLFITAPDGRKVATANAWWSFRGEEQIPSLHWIAVVPGSQNLGLGKAVVARALEVSQETDGDRPCFLHTQTWSYKAVGIYLGLGFKILRSGSFARFGNGFEAAWPILQKVFHRPFSLTEHTIGPEEIH